MTWFEIQFERFSFWRSFQEKILSLSKVPVDLNQRHLIIRKICDSDNGLSIATQEMSLGGILSMVQTTLILNWHQFRITTKFLENNNLMKTLWRIEIELKIKNI